MESNGNSPLIQYSTLSDIVYNWIRDAILNSEFKPGERLSQEMITGRLQVSRTPVRDAFKRLQTEGLLEIRPNSGAIVTRLSAEKLAEIYELRTLLEGPAARYACQNITDQDIEHLAEINQHMMLHREDPNEFIKGNRAFHTALYGYSNRNYLVNYIFQLWDLIEPYRIMYISKKGKAEGSIQEHLEVISALTRRDEAETERVIVEHLKKVVTTLSIPD